MEAPSFALSLPVKVMDEDADVFQWLKENREQLQSNIATEHSYRLAEGTDRSCASIFMVPNTLKEKDAIFTPQAVSIGLYHFLEPHLAQMEQEKSKIIARAVMSKLHSYFFKPLEKVRDGGSLNSDLRQDNNFFGCVVPRSRKFYGDAHQLLQKLNEEAFAMMMFRDASFLLLFLEHHVFNTRNLMRSKPSASDNVDPFHDLKSGTALWLGVKMDIIKLENQVPLSILESLYAHIGSPHHCYADFLANVCSEYSPFWSSPSQNTDLVGRRHLLDCVHATVYVKRPPVRFVKGAASGESPSNCWSIIITFLKNKCPWVRSNKRNSKGNGPLDAGLRNYAKIVLPSASQLSKAGVKFRRCTEGGIEQIRFDGAQSTLYLPQLKIGPMTETIVRNLIAFELCSPEIKENSVVAYARLLKELTQDARDAEVLRRNEIFANLGLGDEKMVEIVKGLSRSTWKPYCKPVNDARKSLQDYYSRSTIKILWSEFRETYCSKPWIVISALAATALLIMTAMQVFCLFYTCNKIS